MYVFNVGQVHKPLLLYHYKLPFYNRLSLLQYFIRLNEFDQNFTTSTISWRQLWKRYVNAIVGHYEGISSGRHGIIRIMSPPKIRSCPLAFRKEFHAGEFLSVNSFETFESQWIAYEEWTKWKEALGNKRPWKTQGTPVVKYCLSEGRDVNNVLKSFEAWSISH